MCTIALIQSVSIYQGKGVFSRCGNNEGLRGSHRNLNGTDDGTLTDYYDMCCYLYMGMGMDVVHMVVVHSVMGQGL